MSNGKGDAYRPVNQKVYGENYDNIFRRTNVQRIPANKATYEATKQICPQCGYLVGPGFHVCCEDDD